jgi:hypothetical protein
MILSIKTNLFLKQYDAIEKSFFKKYHPLWGIDITWKNLIEDFNFKNITVSENLDEVITDKHFLTAAEETESEPDDKNNYKGKELKVGDYFLIKSQIFDNYGVNKIISIENDKIEYIQMSIDSDTIPIPFIDPKGSDTIKVFDNVLPREEKNKEWFDPDRENWVPIGQNRIEEVPIPDWYSNIGDDDDDDLFFDPDDFENFVQDQNDIDERLEEKLEKTINNYINKRKQQWRKRTM